MRLHSILLATLFALASTGCAGWYSTSIELQDGSTLETIPRCVQPDGVTLRVDSHEHGIPVADVRDMRSHAGTEPAIVGALVIAAGAALLLWWANDDSNAAVDARLPVGGVLAGLGLIQFSIGLILNRSSASSLNRDCSRRGYRPPPESATFWRF